MVGEPVAEVRFGGVNHFFWITGLRYGGRDLLADLNRRLKRKGFTELRREAHPDPMGFQSHRELATELWKAAGVMPYLGDRHTCEFLPAYITSRKHMRKYKLVRTSTADRRKMYSDRAKVLRKWARSGMPEDGLKRSRETAADIVRTSTETTTLI